MISQKKQTRDIKLKCKCGALRGIAKDISNSTGRRAVCLCDDCQAYAHYLGIASEVLDASGGSDIFPMAPAKIKITQGLENLKCLRLTPKGLFRWYAGCCNTPIANSISPRIPFAGVALKMMDLESDGLTRDQAVGLVQANFQARFGIKPLPPNAHLTVPLRMILTTIKFLTVGFLKRDHRPSPFFDDQGRPKVTPYLLTREERKNLRELCGPR